jgi:hypothetical protein
VKIIAVYILKVWNVIDITLTRIRVFNTRISSCTIVQFIIIFVAPNNTVADLPKAVLYAMAIIVDYTAVGN